MVWPDYMDEQTFQRLEGVAYATAYRRLRTLEKTGTLRPMRLLNKRGRPKKLYAVNRALFAPKPPRASDLTDFLLPLVKLEKNLRYVLGAPLSTSAHGRVSSFPPFDLLVEPQALRLVKELYHPYREVMRLRAADEQMLANSVNELGLRMLSVEDTVALYVNEEEHGMAFGGRWYSPHVMGVAAVLLRRYLVERQAVNAAYLCKRVVTFGAAHKMLELDSFLKEMYKLNFLTKKWQDVLRTFAASEPRKMPLDFDASELETFVKLPTAYFESRPWARFFGWRYPVDV